MNSTLIVAYLRQRLTSPIRLAFLAVAFLFPLLFVTAAPAAGLSQITDCLPFVLILGAGMIGQDVSSGVLQLVLARPVTRREYVISRWLATAFGATTLSTLQVSLASMIVLMRGGAVTTEGVATTLLATVSSAFGAAAVLSALSALAPGLADLGLFFMFVVSASIAQMVGGAAHAPWVTRAGTVLSESLNPVLEWNRIFGAAVSWHELAAYASSVTLALAIGILVLNRRELSYASG